MKEKRRKKVFISYAREDQVQADKIYQYLSDANFDPWMDVHDIAPGADWFKSISRAIKQTDYFLAILSRNSVNKPGVLQQELDFALEICKKIPDPEIFLIPVRIEECKMPDRISQYQWVNLFEEDGWVQLLRALYQERQTRPKLGWRLLAPITGLLLVAAFLAFGEIFRDSEPDPALYANSCQVSEVPLQVGLANLENCTTEDQNTLIDILEDNAVQITTLAQPVSSSREAQSLTGYDLIVRGSCKGETTVQFDLVSSRKPDEVYEPTSLQVTGAFSAIGDVGKALISYQRGEYAEAAHLFEVSELADGVPELGLLKANSLMFNGRYEEAISVLKDIVGVQAMEWGAAYNNLGVALFNLDLLQEKSGPIFGGLYEFDRSIEYAANEKDTETLLLAYTNKSDLLRRAGNWEEAASACQAALRLSTQSSLPHVCLASYKIGRYAGLPADFSRLLDAQDDLDNAKHYIAPPAKFYLLQGSLYRLQGKEQEALVNYEHFLEAMENRACLESNLRYLRDTARFIAQIKP